MTEDFKYLSHYVSKQIFKILKINLNKDSFEVVKNEDVEHSFYNVDKFSTLIEKYIALGHIHSTDLSVFLEKLNYEYIEKHFKKYEELDCWYRRSYKNEYHWTLLKMIKTPNYKEGNEEIYLFLQDNDVPNKVSINTKIVDEYKLFKSLTNIFLCAYVIDFINDSYVNYKSTDKLEMVASTGVASKDLALAVNAFIFDDFKASMLEFVNIKDINERIGDSNYIFFEALSKDWGWVRTGIFPIEHDYEGKISSAIFVVNVVDKQKKREEELLRLSEYDVLTGLFNRYKYENDISKLSSLNNIVVLSIDVNGLKFVNDLFGHSSGDELIKATGYLLNKVLLPYGKSYRTGGDEFVAIINVDDSKLEDIVGRLKTEANEYETKGNYKLSVAIGVASSNDYPNATIRDLVDIADHKMYNDKNYYYDSNNIVKYR